MIVERITRTAKFHFNEETRESDDESDSIGFRGHSAVFDKPTLIGSRSWGFVELISQDAFRNVLNDDVRFLFNHDGMPMARTTNGTLRLGQDLTGQTVDADLAPTTEARDLSILLSRGDIDQMSFAFGLNEDSYNWSTYESDNDLNGMDLRTINTFARQYDVSPVTYPAYEGTDAGLRALNVTDDEIRDALKEVRSESSINEDLTEALAKRVERESFLFETRKFINTTKGNNR